MGNKAVSIFQQVLNKDPELVSRPIYNIQLPQTQYVW